MGENEAVFRLTIDFGSLQQVEGRRWKKNRLPKRRLSSLCQRGKFIPFRLFFLAWNSEPLSPAECRLQLFDLFFVVDVDDDVSLEKKVPFFPFNIQTLFSFRCSLSLSGLGTELVQSQTHISIYNRNFIAFVWIRSFTSYMRATDTAFTPSQRPVNISQAKRRDEIKMNLSKINNACCDFFFRVHFHFRFVENPFSSFDFEPTKYAWVGCASFEYRKSVDWMQSIMVWNCIFFFFVVTINTIKFGEKTSPLSGLWRIKNGGLRTDNIASHRLIDFSLRFVMGGPWSWPQSHLIGNKQRENYSHIDWTCARIQ